MDGILPICAARGPTVDNEERIVMRRKVLTIVLSVGATLAVVLGVLWYIKTLPARRYNAQTKELRRIVERQELELKAYQYNQTLLKIKEQAKPKPKVKVEQLPAPTKNDPNE